MTDDISTLLDDPFGDSPAGLEDMVVMGNPFFRVAVPASASPQFKRYVVAAAQTCQLRNVSVDHVLRTYRQDAHVRSTDDPFLAPVRLALREVKSATRSSFENMHRVHKPAHSGIFVSWAALYRLQATIRSICFTIVQGFHFESAVLQRLMLEQLAWVAAVRTIPDVAYFNVRPQRSLASLKVLFPKAGHIYGQLSEKAHLTPEQTKTYIISSDGQLSARYGQRLWTPIDAMRLLILADMYIVLTELLVPDLLQTRTSIRRLNGIWVPKRSRPFYKVVRRLSGKLLRLVEKGDGSRARGRLETQP